MEKKAALEEVIKYRLPNYHRDFPLILFWSQKSGCTTLLKWFFYQIGLLNEAVRFNPWVHYYENEVYKSQPEYREELMEQILSEQKDTVKLVRNPYKRAVSQFLILPSTKGIPNWDGEWEKIREFLYGDKNSDRGISFKQFLLYVKDYPGVIDDHLTPQYLEGEEMFVSNYVYLESFSKQIRAIEKKYRLKKAAIGALTDSLHHLTDFMVLKGGEYAELEITPNMFIGHKKLPTSESFYNQETIELVNHIYKKDFEVYRYTMKNDG
ncbi:sulfotransferase family 2 domain-containing protein [Bacillus rubiinfantis]|uniref:sulfotransferase family 2 domain-containing protein n=1 Tax=Bacillus rubiinfantis TaxID=1499680 RepID=UPI0005AB2EAB|nr:sulfotransferase family 2 domain-containing protein [Bacillus rubiinfantis]